MKSSKSVADSIRDTQDKLLRMYPESVLFGLGVNDPKRVFGTTSGLVEKYGIERVFETPTAENAMLGVAVGMAISGMKPIVVHQRLDFFLLAMDQLVNSAAKWRYMFGDEYETTMIIRLINGRGWGQGPTHSQNLHAWFTHIPGLRVAYPAFATDFEQVYQEAFTHKYPTLILEDRWVHQSTSKVNNENQTKIGMGARVLHSGDKVTLLTFGFNSIIGMQVCDFYREYGVDVEQIDLISLKPIDYGTILESVKKTRRCLIVDSGFEYSSIGAYISHQIYKRLKNELLSPIQVITAGDIPEPTSHGVISYVKVSAVSLALGIQSVLDGIPSLDFSQLVPKLHDVPDASFKGPF